MRFSEDRIEQLTCCDDIKRDIHIWEHETPRAVFLTIHGLMDHAGNYLNPGIYMRSKGYALVALEQQGHDHKRKVHIPRFDVLLDDCHLILAWVKEEYRGVPIFIMGHSMGGLILTHYVIKQYKEDPQVKGFILSSPAYLNNVKVSKLLIMMSRFLSAVAPKMTVPLEDLRMQVTRDQAEYKRMREDERDGFQATKMSARMGNEFLIAQHWVPEHIAEWKYPMLAILPGDDRLNNTAVTRDLLSRISEGLVTEAYYPENYHESFNELNREEVFSRILEWCEPRIN